MSMSNVQALRHSSPGRDAGPIGFRDVGSTGPGTLAGHYLRQFWQPVYHSADLKPGEAKPLRIMGQDYTLYRGASGAPYVIDARCPHRAMPMHLGWVEGEEVRCFYHGWKFAGTDGRCTEQPAERPDFCHKIQTGAYAAQDYLGLVFAFLGEGTAPELPRYPAFESEDVICNLDSYTRACHFFNNLENAGDKSHIAFAHHDASASWDESTDGPTISADESGWGITFRTMRPSGRETVSQFGMPNIYYARGVPDDPEVQFREFIAWWVPHDDDRHTQFTVSIQPKHSDVTPRYQQRRAEKLARQDLDRELVARNLLDGTWSWADVDKRRVANIFLQDDVAQMGVGPVATRQQEHLGRADVGLILQRKLWVRELDRCASGEPQTNWRYDPATIQVKAEY
jgi:5,5'-dehydrodivanillate O-demethylase